jgi:hypothetical protein
MQHRVPAPTKIRRGRISDTEEACTIVRRPIAELCGLDHAGDPAMLQKWLSNKTVENLRRWIADSHFFVAEGKRIAAGLRRDERGRQDHVERRRAQRGEGPP